MLPSVRLSLRHITTAQQETPLMAQRPGLHAPIVRDAMAYVLAGGRGSNHGRHTLFRIRPTGPEKLGEHWPGSADGLASLTRLLRLPQSEG